MNNSMKKYIRPLIEVIQISPSDIITTSGGMDVIPEFPVIPLDYGSGEEAATISWNDLVN